MSKYMTVKNLGKKLFWNNKVLSLKKRTVMLKRAAEGIGKNEISKCL